MFNIWVNNFKKSYSSVWWQFAGQQCQCNWQTELSSLTLNLYLLWNSGSTLQGWSAQTVDHPPIKEKGKYHKTSHYQWQTNSRTREQTNTGVHLNDMKISTYSFEQMSFVWISALYFHHLVWLTPFLNLCMCGYSWSVRRVTKHW